MCRMEDDPSTYDEDILIPLGGDRFAHKVPHAQDDLDDFGDIPPNDDYLPFDENREDDPSVQHEPVTEENIALPVINRYRSIGEPVYETLPVQCSNPDCACKGPSFRSEPVSMGEERRKNWFLRNLHARTTK